MSWFNLAETHCFNFKSEPLNNFENIENNIDIPAKHISVRAEWLCQSAHALLVPIQTPWWWTTLPLPSGLCVALHIAL
jgi:hypothetical protein